jgi:hypothetical protein
MSHFAKLDANNIVTFVTVGRQEDDGQEAELTARTGDVYKQTSYNTSGGVHRLGGTPLRKNYAGIGYTYDSERDAFIPPKPYHFLGAQRRQPACGMLLLPCPTDVGTGEPPKRYTWDEEAVNWIEVTA